MTAASDNQDAGSLSILNVSAGDIRITFEKNDPADVERASRFVKDMLRRGYAIFVEVDGELVPVKAFDEKQGAYLVMDVPPDPAAIQQPKNKPRVKRGRKLKPISMRKHRATGVAPTAGG